MSAVRFDDSLPAFACLVQHVWGDAALHNNLFLRDASGRLTFVLLHDAHSADERSNLAAQAAAVLGSYVDGEGFSVATPDELFDDSLKDRTGAAKLTLGHPLFTGSVFLVDRRLVGADWLRSPQQPATTGPARFVFASLKGGVGRSTALCVLAAHLAARGHRVLAIDMDLEAPGPGNLLLPDGTLPMFGLLDYLVESEAGNSLDDQFFADILGPSWLGGGKGRVDVIPAIGQRSIEFPANVLAKLARAYLAGSGSDGQVTFSDRMRILVERFADPSRYDAILVDARAGLHETTAAAVLGLGAEVFFFGMDQPQTFTGYELLFAHLATLSGSRADEWQARLHLVQSKAPVDVRLRAKFAERMESLFSKYLWVPLDSIAPTTAASDLTDTFEVEWSEENGTAVESLIAAESPAPVMAILDDERFRSFDPIADRDILADRAYAVSFGQLLERAESIIGSLADGSMEGTRP